VRLLALIPARAGSKGLPGKNTRALAGQSLIERAVRCAHESKVVDRVVLTTDDPHAAEIARRCGADVPFPRPAELAGDSSPMFDVVAHALGELMRGGYQCDAVLLLQPTSPLREPRHIKRAVELLPGKDSVCSVVPLPATHNPYYVMRIREDGALDNFLADGKRYTRRQDVPPAYVRDGTIYLTAVETITQHKSLYGAHCQPLILSPEESLSIDTLEDWNSAEARISARVNG
jgi:N-acylneuraminate cytidylyltransferase